jgi:hypothetical protein
MEQELPVQRSESPMASHRTAVLRVRDSMVESREMLGIISALR